MVLKIKENKKRSDIKLACGGGIVVMLGLLLVSAALWNTAQLSSDQTNTNTNINMLGQPASAASHSPIYIDGDDPDHD